MAKFIPIEKIKALREASKNGDERAKRILLMQMNGEDYSPVFDEYFSTTVKEPVKSEPIVEKSGLEKFLEFNNINREHPEYKDYVQEYYNENPQEKDENVLKKLSEMGEEKTNQYLSDVAVDDNPKQECSTLVELIKNLIEDENEAIQGYDKGILFVANSEKDRNILNVLNEIKTDEIRHIKMLKELVE